MHIAMPKSVLSLVDLLLVLPILLELGEFGDILDDALGEGNAVLAILLEPGDILDLALGDGNAVQA